ncbi:related to PPR1-transcription factor regulating pyrimidine pathway [Sporisorium reilianum SRZ2]|uniref:Related to PPR1-transcription factor regulating pyrimidine pathway n=1 Tax=Sporisorium reilianum (strain SRZ2) TaxID=999809 RepID=E6ZKU0_SPORE|nr:related to PPR1-transcription factor regulating pyrimidine pathway [Sporisorium reilianum SRZ2]
MTPTTSGSNGEPSGSASTSAGPSTTSAAKPAKRKPEKTRESPSSLDATDAHGTKPLARAVLVCKRCRSKKIKCDQAFPACGSCVKAGEPCVGIDSATGREVSRSYIVDLEHQLAELRAQNAELERLLAEQPSSRPANDASSGLKRPLQHVKTEFPLDRSESAASPDPRPAKRLATSPRNEDEQEAPQPLLPGLVLGPAGVEVVSSTSNENKHSHARPLLGRLNSHASGLSPAGLLCQAIQQSAQAGLRIHDPGSTSRGKKFGTQSLGEDLRRRAKTNSSREPSRPDGEARGNSDHDTGFGTSAKAEVKSASPHSGSVTPSDGKKNSPFDDGDPMQYATATETADITVPAPEQALKPSPLPAPFPPLSVARKLIDAYFERVNPQLPILDRASFTVRFENACRIGLERTKAKLTAEQRRQLQNDDDKISIEMQPADGHLFHLVFAIAAAMGWTRSSWSAENHHEAAMRYLDPRRLIGSGQEGNVGAIMGRDALEQLQCLLLTALYSIMRPMKPGVWYCLGVALRLTTGIGLYTETPGVLEASGNQPQDASETLVEKKRRLFWCSYALDRQVCVHLGRPFGIADSDIKVNLPWVHNESEMVAMPIAEGENRVDADEEDVDSSTEMARREAASTLAALQASTNDQQGSSSHAATVSLPKPKDASRWVSLSFFRMRILQSEIQSMLYQNAELPRRFDSYAHWKTDILRRLHAWRRYAPSSKKDLEASGCGYNPIFLELNYQQTLLMVYGLSPRFPNASRKDLANVEECSRSIINMYATLSKEGQMNYTWMTGHNVFIACTSYLYAIWQISATDPASFRSSVTLGFRNKVDEIHHFAAACDKVLSSLQWATAEKCRKCLRTMFYATSVVVEKIDRMSAARSGNLGRLEGGTIGEEETRPTAGRSSAKKGSQTSAESQPEHAQKRSSSVSKRNAPTAAPAASSWSLYSQERDWRPSPAKRSNEPALPSPQSESSMQAARWSQSIQGRASPGSGVFWPVESETATYRSDFGSSTRGVSSNPSERNRLTTASADAHSSDATTPSRGLDVGSSLVDANNSSTTWYGFGSETSPKMLFPDSPSNFDISSLMATSAMELDALFREAGLSAGPSVDQRDWLDNTSAPQPHNSAPAAQYPLNSGARDHSGPHVVQAETMGTFYDPVQSVSSGTETRGKWAFDSGPVISVEQQGVVGPMADGEGFETDWEALGFGFRMNGAAQYNSAMPMFSDQSGQPPPQQQPHQQQQQGGFVGARGHPNQHAGSGPGAAEFDQRFLDSHMGF